VTTIRIPVFIVLLGVASFSVSAQSLIQRAEKKASPMTNPFGHDSEALSAGAKLYKHECGACHGEAGKGTGRRRTPPLATPTVRNANPGTLFWILKNGSENSAMPSFAHVPEPERWQIIAYLQGLSSKHD
jgi:mono/diheme cytochrome c family protein